MDATPNDGITVSALRSRLSDLQTLWGTTTGEEEHLPHSDSATASTARTATEEPYDRDVSHVYQRDHCPPHPVAKGPAKPSTLPLISPRSFESHGTPTSALMNNEARDQACHSFVRTPSESLIPVSTFLTPKTPFTRSTVTPQARPRSVAGTQPTSSPARTSHEAIALPPIQTHFVGTTPVRYARCGTKEARAPAAH